MIQNQLDFEARRLRDDGMQRAVDHADAVSPGWQTFASHELAFFLLSVPRGTTFLSEDVRKSALDHGLPEPPDNRAWGAVMMRAAKAGLIVKLGWTTATDPKVHKNPVSLWKKS